MTNCTLDSEDDAATVNWGEAWRMPVKGELLELWSGCSWKFVEDFNHSGVAGFLGTSVKNGKTIFLPAAGAYSDTKLSGVGTYCFYWSSYLSFSSQSLACGLNWEQDGSHYFEGPRCQGPTIRAVLK